MTLTKNIEASILNTSAILLVLSRSENNDLLKNFCGTVIDGTDSLSIPDLSKKTVYLCGDISKANGIDLNVAKRVFIIDQLSYNNNEGYYNLWSHVDLGKVPINVQGVGVYYRRFFDQSVDQFNLLLAEHEFQSLTESTKPRRAHRTGIYLTPVEKSGDDLHFHLLRCSTNLSGPTENFRANDKRVVDALNIEADCIFENHAPLNHVLAQVYHNTPATTGQKQTKAKISAHADKTKDMPTNGIMAFCTFYDQLDKLQPIDNQGFDYGYKGRSGMTKLHFRLKKVAADNNDTNLCPEFTVALYPNSVFFMPLSTNRRYTHEIQSSILDAERLPTRLGYVVRCSKTEAIHKNGQTFIKQNGQYLELEQASPEGMQALRSLYVEENKTQDFINYNNKFLFSMNSGDYQAPRYTMADEFRTYPLPNNDNLFEELLASIQFEDVGKGRQGAVLIKTDDAGNIPIVRTTTQYNEPAQHFSAVHDLLANEIQKSASLSIDFNNALIENYTNDYTTMGYHSDQALDLQDESLIAVYSCYKDNEKNSEWPSSSRMLVLESKEDGTTFEIPLLHNSVVIFSLSSNQRFKHKIVLDNTAKQDETHWLGITFRTSKTFVKFHGKQAFMGDTLLTLATDEQKREFYTLRGRENKEVDFSYSALSYTISESDLMLLAPT